MNLNPQAKAKLLKLYPQLSPFFQQQETNSMVRELKDKSDSQADAFVTALIGKIEAAKGEDGYTPIKGKDYFDGKDGRDGKDGIDGKDGKIGETGARGLRGYTGEDGKDGKDGKDIVTHETPESLSKKLNTLKESVDVSVIKGAVSKKEVLDGMARVDGRIKLIDQRWHGGGLQNINGLVQAGTNVTISGSGTKSDPYIVNSTGGSGGTWYQDEIVATGQTGTAFSLLHTPTSIVFLYLNGQYLVSGAGKDYTRSGTSITLTNALISSDLLTANYS